MTKRAAIFAAAIVALPLLFLVSACGDGGPSPSPTGLGDGGPSPSPTGLGDGDPSPSATGLPRVGIGADLPIAEGFGVKSELVIKADFPVTLAFAPDGRLFYNELNTGNIRIITADGKLLAQPFANVDVSIGAESGLLGLAIDPEFASNHYVYVYFTAPVEEDDPFRQKLQMMRFTDVDNVGTDPTVIGDLPEALPANGQHVGGNIHFGPDGYLYVTIGDNTRPDLAQDLSTIWGKILRINKADGSAAPDNPFVDDPDADPRIFAYGFRNSFDFTFHPLTGQLYATENGPTDCDELNLVVAGGNYGWPRSVDTDTCQNNEGIEAIHFFTPFPARHPGQSFSTVAPTGIEFLSSKMYPLLPVGSLLVCEANLGYMRHFSVDGVDLDVVGDGSIVDRFCRLDIVVGPEGFVYYSNTEEIRRLVPE